MFNFARKNIKSKYVIIFSDLMSIIQNESKVKKTLIEIEEIVKTLILNENTIILPTYNLNFPKTKKTSNEEQYITTGFLTKFLLKKFTFKRTNKPMYNYAVMGPNAKKILKLEQSTAWGRDSVIRFLSENKKTIGIGVNTSLLDFYWGTVHSCEEYLKVPYRFYKTFYGKNIFTNNKVKEKMYVRHLDKEEVNLKQKIILKKLVVQKKLIVKKCKYINFNIINLNKYYTDNLTHIEKILKVKK